jgi:hypothetical protein
LAVSTFGRRISLMDSGSAPACPELPQSRPIALHDAGRMHCQLAVWLRVESSAGEPEMNIRLSAPTTIVFVISVVLAILAALAAMGSLSLIPIASVWLMAIAYVVLAASCLIKGA